MVGPGTSLDAASHSFGTPFRARVPDRRAAAGIFLAALLAGCASSSSEPTELFELAPEAMAQRAAQTRHFDTPASNELLSASAAVLQGLGFQVTETSREVGFLRASKERGAREYGQEMARVFVVLLSVLTRQLYVMPVDLHQQINAAVVARPLDEAGERHELRVQFYRLVWKGSGQGGGVPLPPGDQRMEMIRDPEIYRQFFARLSESVFLEAHEI